jgi:hypothetical protein
MLEFIIFLIVFTALTSLSVFIFRLKNLNMQLIIALNEAISDIERLSQRPDEGLVEKEHLLSFINETRDIAYKYIEEVHIALLEYKDSIEYDLENPNDLSIQRFRKAFNKLKEIYPKDIPND